MSPVVVNQRRDLQAQQEQGTKRANYDGDHSNSRKPPISCAWRGNCGRRGLKLPAPRSSDRDAPGDLQIWCSGYVSGLGDGNTSGYWILAPLYLLWPRKLLPPWDLKNSVPTAAIRMGDGHVLHSCGDCEVDVPIQQGALPIGST